MNIRFTMRAFLAQLVAAFALLAFVDAALNKGFLRFQQDLFFDNLREESRFERLSNSNAFIFKIPIGVRVLCMKFECNACEKDLILPSTPRDSNQDEAIVAVDSNK